MKPRVEPAALKKTAPWEYAVRFVFGGLVTVGAGIVANTYGPSIGGLFLAFPAILPASLTLAQEHDGRKQAADDARGAVLGTVGLAAFALVAWVLAPTPPWLALLVASLAWAVSCGGAWAARYGRKR